MPKAGITALRSFASKRISRYQCGDLTMTMRGPHDDSAGIRGVCGFMSAAGSLDPLLEDPMTFRMDENAIALGSSTITG